MKFIESKKPTITIHQGAFIDEHTFLDPNGTPYDLIASKFPPKKEKEKKKIIVDRKTGKVRIYDPDFGWREVF